MKPLVLLDPALPPFLVEPVQAAYETRVRPAAPADLASIRAMVLPGGAQISVEDLDAHPALEIITVFGVGYDGVPVEACRQRNIRVTNTPDVLTEDVADIALALTLMTHRRLARAEQFVRDGNWLQGAFPLATSVTGKLAGIVGLGRIGKAIARRLEACGMRIAYHGRKAQPGVGHDFYPDLADLARASDMLVIACPGGPATQHLINADILAALGTKGILVNISRGSVVDETALVAAISAGIIAGAGLDVFAKEPGVPAELITSDRVVLLPHVGSATHETRAAMAQLCLKNLDAHFSGQPLPTPVA